MGNIQVLSFEVANLIAAGEVVDRPASAIKEMMENAIDAGAKHITVEIQNGGVSFMRVTDDGCGMSEEDLPMAIRRHATSKIRNAEDLDGIMTLGFRGEALAAISSVSDMRILSKRPEDEVGHMLEIRGGRLIGVTERGCRDGTTIIVENLFANVPARRKFLKRDATESMAVTANVERVALSHPEIAFRLIADGVTKLETAGDGLLKSAVWAVFGRDFANRMIPLDSEYEGIRITGFISRSDNVRGSRNGQMFFINNRFVKSNTAQTALEQAFTSYIPPEKYPCCVMNIGLNPARVDVNVHPAKLEVKFSNEKPVFEAVYYAVRQALEQNTTRPEFTMPRKKPLIPGVSRVSDATRPVETEKPAPLGKRQISMDMPVPKESSGAVTYKTVPSSANPSSTAYSQGGWNAKPATPGATKPTDPPKPTGGGRRFASAPKKSLPPIRESDRITAEDYLRFYNNRYKLRRNPPEFIGTVRVRYPEERAEPPKQPAEPLRMPPPEVMEMDEVPMDVYEAEARAMFGDSLNRNRNGEKPRPVETGAGKSPTPSAGIRRTAPASSVPTPSAAVSGVESKPTAPVPNTVRHADEMSAADNPTAADNPSAAAKMAVSDKPSKHAPTETAQAPAAKEPYRIVGEVFRSYVLVEQGDHMLIIDKHAAHERIIFEQLKASMRNQAVDAQILLMPIDVMVLREDVGILESYRRELEAVGFFFNCNDLFVQIYGIPSGVKIERVPEMIGSMLAQLSDDVDNAKLTRDTLFEKALYQAACKAAIKAGREYPPEHIQWLVDKLMELPDITFCPHGRPVAMEMKKRNIDHQFERC